MSKRRRGKAISRKWRENEARRCYWRIVRDLRQQREREVLTALLGDVRGPYIPQFAAVLR